MKEVDFKKTKNTAPKNAEALSSPVICCQHCQRKACFYVSAVDAHGKVKSQAFCINHAFKEGLLHPRKWELLTFSQPLHAPSETICSCGMTEGLLLSKGRAGCANCYRIFNSHFLSALPRMHPGRTHMGKVPAKAPMARIRRKLKILEIVLQRAIRREAYEQAAHYRDRIKELLSKL